MRYNKVNTDLNFVEREKDVNKFWKEVDDHFEEITKEEYDLRLESYTNKLAERGNNV